MNDTDPAWAKRTTYLSVGMMAGGFLLIVLAWNGAASLDFVQGQIPFLISGGVAGLALIIAGLTLAVIQELRRTTGLLLGKLERLDEIAELVSGGLAPRSSGPTAVPAESDHVVAGRTSYHRSDCRLVEGRNDLQAMAREMAVDRGLAPCRVCEPQLQGTSQIS